MNLKKIIDARVSKALAKAGAPENSDAIVVPAARPQFGDYQANGCMAAAKKLKTNPRQFAESVLEHLDLSDIADKVELAGPGFINIFLKDSWLEENINAASSDKKLGVELAREPKTVVVDYSSPNLAKEMHVGHLRSTIIGDAIARVSQFLGDNVIRQNHVGDWGTQFGMLLNYMNETDGSGQSLADLEDFYRASKKRFDEDQDFATKSRETVVKLQSGDEACKKAWQNFLDISLSHCQKAYDKLGVGLTTEHVRGESFYNDDLPKVLKELDEKGLLDESQEAKGVFLEEFKNKDNERAFIIIQKSDGGYLYATTDLSALRFRADELKADRIFYVTDSRQAQHFAQVFTIARKANFVPENIELIHVPFGMMLGDDGKPFKTRTGGTVKLMDLLEEAISRAGELVAEKNPEITPEQKGKIAEVVGVGALKYADLSQNRNSDYVFSWDKMISLEGNTAPYMQYAYARVRSIFRKANSDDSTLGKIIISEPQERALAVKILQFAEIINSVADNAMPNILCSYLYDLAGAFMSFYEACPVLKSEQPTKDSRLALCDLTSRVIGCGLDLLGINTIEQM